MYLPDLQMDYLLKNHWTFFEQLESYSIKYNVYML